MNAFKDLENSFQKSKNIIVPNVGIGTTTPAYPLTVAGSTIGLGAGLLSLSSTGVSVGNGNNLGSTSPSSVAMGSGNTADVGSVAIGKNNTTVIGSAADAVAIGLGNSVPRDSATAIGKNNSVGGNGYFSLAAGYANAVSGTNGVAVGYSNSVTADGASAFGQSIVNSTANSTQIGPSDTAKVTILSSGDVGIGTSTPGAKLEVAGQVKITGGTPGAGKVLTSDATGLASWSTPSGTTQWTTNGSDIHYSSGKVGVGVSSPTAFIDVTGDEFGASALRLRSGDGSVAPANSNQVLFSYNGGANYSHAIRSRHNSSGAVGNALDFYTWNYGTDAAGTAGTKHVMTMDGNGNVGLGTTAPTYRLDINDSTDASSLRISSTGIVNQSALLLENLPLSTDANTGKAFAVKVNGEGFGRSMFYSDGKYGIGSGAATRDTFISRHAASVLKVSSDGGAGAADLVVNGKVGVGTTAPDTKLHVVGTSGTTLKIVDGNQAAGKVLTSDANGVASWSTLTGTTQWTTTGSDIYYSAGNVGVGTAAPSGVLHVAKSDAGSTVGNSVAAAIKIENTGGFPGGRSSGAGVKFSHFGGGQTFGYIGTIVTDGNLNGSADMVFAVKQDSTVGDVTEYMTIKSGGKVGIGTTSPGAQLEVDTSSTSDIGLKVWGLNGQTAHLQSWGIPSNGTMAYVSANGTIYSNNSVWGNGLHSTDAGGYRGVTVDGQNRGVTFSVPGSSTMDSRIYRSAASVLTVDNSSGGSANLAVTGKIGIGTSSPGYPLDVQGSWPNQITIGATGAAGSIGLRRGAEGAITGTIGIDSAGGQDIKIWNGSGSGSINLALGALTYPAFTTYLTDANTSARSEFNSVVKVNAPPVVPAGGQSGSAVLYYDVTAQKLKVSENGGGFVNLVGGGGVSGSGTANYLTMFSGGTSVADSPLSLSGTNALVFGGTANSAASLQRPGATGSLVLRGGSSDVNGAMLYLSGNSDANGGMSGVEGSVVAKLGNNISSQFIVSDDSYQDLLHLNSTGGLTLIDPFSGLSYLETQAPSQGSKQLYVKGNVGIGTAAPGHPLDVNGKARSSGFLVANDMSLLSGGGLQATVSGWYGIQLRGSLEGTPDSAATNVRGKAESAHVVIPMVRDTGYDSVSNVPGLLIYGKAAQTADYFQIGSNGSTVAQGGDVFVVNASGNVGIGTTSPDQLLSVNGDASKVGGGSWQTFSDARLKTVNGPFTRGLAEVLGLQPVSYHYNDRNPAGVPNNGDHIGFVAQEIEKQIPEAISHSKKGFLMVNNDPILWTMFNAIKELYAMIVGTDSEVEKLKVENAELKARVDKQEEELRKIKEKLGID